MKTSYKHIEFVLEDFKWICRSKKTNNCLGRVEYYCRWKQYIFCPETRTVYSAGCLKDIANFLKQLNKQ